MNFRPVYSRRLFWALFGLGLASCINASLKWETYGALNLNPNSRSLGFSRTIQFSATGGVPPYTFSFAGVGDFNSSTFQYTSPSTPGTATITVTDAEGATDSSLITIAASGQLDLAFAGAGFKIVSSSGIDLTPQAIDTDPNTDRVVVAGRLGLAGATNTWVARFLPNGDLDPQFGGGDGIFTTDLAVDFGFDPDEDRATAVKVLPDSRILVGGVFRGGLPTTGAYVIRLNGDGTRDLGFGPTGRIDQKMSASDDLLTALDTDSAGNIILVGYGPGVGGLVGVYASNTDPVLGFDGDGQRLTCATHESKGMVLSPLGSIIQLGGDTSATKKVSHCVTDSAGTQENPEESIGDGVIPQEAFAAGRFPSGRYVAAGDKDTGGNRDMLLIRFSSSFAQDTSPITVDFGGADSNVRALAIDPDTSDVVVAGSTANSTKFAVARLSESLVLDSLFASGGKFEQDFEPGGTEGARAAAIDSQGRIYITGITLPGATDQLFLMRLTP